LNYLELDSSEFSREIPPFIGNLSQLTFFLSRKTIFMVSFHPH